MSSGHRVLLIGSGSREHSIALKLAESTRVKDIFVAPGNGGTESSGNHKIYNLKGLDVSKNEEVLNWCKEQKPSLVVIGPEDPLERGLADILIANNFDVFGPTRLAAQIECDKGFAKDFMYRNKIPTAEYKLFTDAKEALDFLDKPTFNNPLVIKATGLALGKGVVVAKSINEAKQAVKEMLVDKKFGSSSETIVIEEFLGGDEFSVLAFSDGETIRLMPTAQDHKRAYFKDQGPNTGGMGCISPFILLTDEKLKEVKQTVMQATIDCLKKEGRPFIGVLFAGLMLTPDNNVKVLEFNCRFGDPETQTILPLLESDLFNIMLSCAKKNSVKDHSNLLSSTVLSLDRIPIDFEKKNVVSYVCASGGYPETSTKHQEIRGLDAVKAANRDNLHIEIYHAATYLKNSKYYTNGGRCFSVVFKSDKPFNELLKLGEILVNNTIDIDDFFYRPDIGQKTVKKFLKKRG